MVEKWFRPRKHTGWHKDQSPATRRRHLMASTQRGLSLDRRRLEAGRRAQALANVTRDAQTKKKARADARHFFGMLK